ncbi:hypothetical protein CBW65_05795 [Tumebacillus avium]|uniref:Histidine kinase N-terminal 7TM region domain-containing protein n=1 Tax=Tumebacillus avium TaxID=1903704 RepID=A0A1Y0IK40_9BACL|nr:hypothetical protein [Tumebacillus avium]ARU60650.1 hypothetical protein CBW65_05795 [Tumebacillus avium]
MMSTNTINNMSNIFLLIMAVCYVTTLLLDLPKLRKATGREKAVYYTMAIAVFGLYMCSLLQINVVLPYRWVVYTWSDWLHGVLTT